MTMIDPFSHHHHHHHQNLDNSKQQQRYYYYSLLFGGTYDGMSRLEEGYECNYASNKSCFLVTESSSADINNNNNNNNSLVDFPMADDHHQYHHHRDEEEDEDEEEESRRTPPAGSTSKDFELHDAAGGSWLKLGLGHHVTNKPHVVDPTSSSVSRPAGLLELTLLPAGTTTTADTSTGSQSQPRMMSAPSPNYMNPSNYINSLMFQQPPAPAQGINYNYYSPSGAQAQAPAQATAPRHQDLNSFVFRPSNDNIPLRNFQSSNYNNFPPTSGSYNNYFTTVLPPFQQLRPTATAAAAPTPDVAAGPSFDFRVISPPRRPHSGLWFILQASQTQSKEPFLPQIPKSYLRIKDGRMTVRMLMKYLVNKLKLDSESEIEIRCKGQQLVPFLTLQYVRDNIWRSKDMSTAATTTSSSSIPRDSSSSSSSSSPANLTIDHVMLLHYSRTSSVIITTS